MPSDSSADQVLQPHSPSAGETREPAAESPSPAAEPPVTAAPGAAGTPPADPALPASSTDSAIWHVLAVVVLVGAADVWLMRHLGYGIASSPAVVGVGGALALAGTLFGKKYLESELGTRVQAAIRRGVTGVRLAAGGLVLGAVMLAVSSVTMIPERGGGAESFMIAPVDASGAATQRTLGPGEELLRVPVWVSPFGRAFRVEAPGYVPGTFIVYPLVGLQLRLGQDLAPSPSVLFRPDVRGLEMLNQGAMIRVWQLRDHGARELIAADSAVGAAFLLGRRRPIPRELVADWRLELDAMGAPADAARRIERIWRDPRPLATEHALAPYTRLEARIVMHGDEVSCAQAMLGTDRLLDVPLTRCPVEGPQ